METFGQVGVDKNDIIINCNKHAGARQEVRKYITKYFRSDNCRRRIVRTFKAFNATVQTLI
jgi:hypothetical protein